MTAPLGDRCASASAVVRRCAMYAAQYVATSVFAPVYALPRAASTSFGGLNSVREQGPEVDFMLETNTWETVRAS
jgi:hypothetical protein